MFPGIPPPARGAYRDRHGRWKRDAMDVKASSDVRCIRGLRRRVVLAPLGWCQVCKVMILAGDGDYQVTDTGKSAQQALTPSRGECRLLRLHL